MKEVFKNLANSDQDMKESLLSQLVNKMGEKKLEDWIRSSNMSDELKEKMLNDMKKLIGLIFALCEINIFYSKLIKCGFEMKEMFFWTAMT